MRGAGGALPGGASSRPQRLRGRGRAEEPSGSAGALWPPPMGGPPRLSQPRDLGPPGPEPADGEAGTRVHLPVSRDTWAHKGTLFCRSAGTSHCVQTQEVSSPGVTGPVTEPRAVLRAPGPPWAPWERRSGEGSRGWWEPQRPEGTWRSRIRAWNSSRTPSQTPLSPQSRPSTETPGAAGGPRGADAPWHLGAVTPHSDVRPRTTQLLPS